MCDNACLLIQSNSPLGWKLMRLLGLLLLACTTGQVADVSSQAAETLRFSYDDGKPSPTHASDAGAPRAHEQAIPHTAGVIYIYATFGPVLANPTELIGDVARGSQSLSIGHSVGGNFTPGVSLGIAKDTHVGLGSRTLLLPWVAGGQLDYYGMFARPQTPYDFKVKLDIDRKRMTAWVSGRGDDDWYLLAEDAVLENPIDAIDMVRVSQNVGSPDVELTVRTSPWPEGESVRPHPKSKQGQQPMDRDAFRLQSMRSVWNLPGRHVSIARNNPKTTPKETAWVGFPDVVQSGPTELVCSFTAGAAHGGGGPILVSRSEDLGKTWGPPMTIHPSGVNCSRIQKLRDGSLLVLADVSVAGTYCVVFYRSTDGGRRWESISYLDPPKIGGRGACVPSRLTEMPDGSWLVVGSWCTGNPFELADGERLEIYRSPDQGKSWALHSILQEYPRSLSEASIVPTASGRLWMFAREACRILPGVKTYSDDGGKTWAPCEELPFPIVGRTCAATLKDGRVLLTTRHGAGRAGLWAWVGDPAEKTNAGIIAAHFNDVRSVGLRAGELHIDNDGQCGQFTQYCLRVPDSPESTIEVTAEVKVVSNRGYAATLSVPYIGKLRILADQVVMAHDPALIAKVEPGVFHTYRLFAQRGKMTLFIDGQEVLSSDNADIRTVRSDWTPLKLSPYLLAFGNEPTNFATFEYTPARADVTLDEWEKSYQQGIVELQQVRAIPPISMLSTTIAREQINPRVSGYSVWKRVETRFEDPKTGIREQSWLGKRDGFPDQYMLDRVLEVEASVGGGDQGYSGWTELEDGRIFVVNYTDDTAPACLSTPTWPTGLPWIRGTFLQPSDLPLGSGKPSTEKNLFD